MNPLGRLVDCAKFCVRKVLSWSPWGRAYYKQRKERQRQKELDTLQRYGGDVLGRIHDLLSREKVAYCLCCGTLLGCVRDGGLMPHDDDIDIAIMPGDVPLQRLISQLDAEGFKFFWAWKCQNRITEFAVTYKGIHIDFYLLKDCGNDYEFHWYMPLEGVKYPDKFSWSTISVSIPKITGLKTIELPKYHICVNVPENYDAILSTHYGPWRIPDANWKASIDVAGGNRRLLTEFGQQVSKESLF